MERRKVTTPKEFFIKERDVYSDWTLSFWREFFQNSVDAGAKNIAITVDTAKPRGSFDGLAPETVEVTRVVFSDDGCGMSKEVLEKVYFSVGATTKGDGGNSIGGYGRARLMTCFSNVRYSVLTNDQFVIGDGAEWIGYGFDEALSEIDKSIAGLLETSGEDERGIQAVEGLRSDYEMISAARSAGGFRGCRIEVDLDPFSGPYYRRPSEIHMLQQLKAYLSESQLSPKVTINGQTPEEFFKIESGRLQARRGPARRSLTVMIGEEAKEFAKVHLSEGQRASHKGKVIVRVDGASMYKEDIAADTQVIIELDPKMSREVMTANRDGLKSEYREELQRLLNELAVDDKSALKERGKERITIEGEKGRIRARRPKFEDISSHALSAAEASYTPHAQRSPRVVPSNAAQLAEFGLPIESVETFFRDFKHGRSFVNSKIWDYDFPFSKEFNAFQQVAWETEWGKEASCFFDKLPTEARGWLLDILKRRYHEEIAKVAAENASRTVISDMHDVVIHVENTNPTVRAAIRRNDPRNWDMASGKGRQPRALLVAWTEACSVAIEALMLVRPSVKEFDWTTGWCYDTAKQTDQGDRYRDYVTKALCITEGDRHALLVNPITEDGRLAFNPSDPGHRQKLQALAMHEVAHIVENWHNETYAGILTDLMEVYDFKEANKRMRNAVKAVYAAYERGKAHIQEMDDEPGPRPADRLLALSAPAGHLNDDLHEAVTHHDDGSRTVDCDMIAQIELDQSSSMEERYAAGYAR